MIDLHNQDCLEFMAGLPDNSIDFCLTDPPYGTTACKWDNVIPFEPMWEQLKRVVKPNGAIVLFGSQPFTSALVMSNVKMFKYEWIWKKDKGGNIAVLKYQPSKVHENILVFSDNKHLYNPQMEERPEKNKRNNKPRYNKVGIQGGKDFFVEHSRGMDSVKYPTSVKDFNVERNGLHPTQKPVALLEYLIKTYTLEGETVFDGFAGSGSTAVACRNTGRNFIGCELDLDYFNAARKRLE